MNNAKRVCRCALSILLFLLPAVSRGQDTSEQKRSPRPNILWITAEDMSPTLGCYGDSFANTPNIDHLASQGVRYSGAFATAPVCSPSRSCLINGLIATSQGTHNMRSAFPIPAFMSGFPSVLGEAGYYTSNNVKTDYNSGNSEAIIRASWDENSETAHWRNRDGDQPFFAVFNLMTSHQSRTMVWPYQQFVEQVQSELADSEIHDPEQVPLPPYYPDTPVVRKTVARYYDCVTVMDRQVGAILKQLSDDGLADDTIVFFYSDHGSGMPRHKRALLDSGMKVPLIVRFPRRYRHLAPGGPGDQTDRLVSFDDFGPTVLNLAGVDIPDFMTGKPFLGSRVETSEREFVFGHRDRVDEVHDLARSVRDKRYLYIRNFMPHLGYNQPTAWPDQGEIRHEFYRLSDPVTMTDAQWHFAAPTRPLEELYDCQSDPMNLHNLVGSKDHRDALVRMRSTLYRHIEESRDLGFLPEAIAWDLSQGTTLWEVARNDERYDQQRLVRAASAVGQADESEFLDNLKHTDAGVRFWGAVGLAALPTVSPAAESALESALSDPVATVRIEAAGALLGHGRNTNAIAVLAAALTEKNLAAVQHAARTIELLGDRARAAAEAMKDCQRRMEQIRPPETSPLDVDPRKDAAMFILFSTEAFLKRFG